MSRKTQMGLDGILNVLLIIINYADLSDKQS